MRLAVAASFLLVACGSPDPAPVAPAPEPWPFVTWDRAEAVAFNTELHFGPGIPLHAWHPRDGWSPHVTARAPITRAQAEAARDRTVATRGTIEVSKCPFPRHAVVFFAGDEPVGSVNVCFECGDILATPPFEEADPALYEAKLAAYDRVYPRWEAFFRDELGWSIAPPPRP